jgi:hypothetical protein
MDLAPLQLLRINSQAGKRLPKALPRRLSQPVTKETIYAQHEPLCRPIKIHNMLSDCMSWMLDAHRPQQPPK